MDTILERRLRRRPDLAFRAIEQEAFVLSTRDQRLHRLNETGAFLWLELDREPTLRALVAALARAFEVSAPRAEEDVVAFARLLVANGLADLVDAGVSTDVEASAGPAAGPSSPEAARGQP